MASMIERRLQELWGQLQGKKPHFPHFLSEIRLDGTRGIKNLKVRFDYPVSVIAGGNASGKSTVLFAAACAYKVPGAGVKDFVPSTLFPDYRPKKGSRGDHRNKVELAFEYETPSGHSSMQWRRSKGWNRSFGGRKNPRQPERTVYLRTLSNLSNPSEVRGVLSMSRSAQLPKETALTASQVELAHQMLPFRYSEVVNLSSSGNKGLLFAAQNGGGAYSELHMSAGERAILRLSREIAQLQGALILIDELEAGLHPWVQQLLMAQLQDLALRNDLQVIVTTHSPVVLDSVPPHGRIFLHRDEGTGEVAVRPAYRDIIQNALYGRSGDALNLLCEDKAAEGVLQGVLDVLLPELEIRTESVRIGPDTGADEFASHAAAFRKFGQIKSFVFVLDGDKRGSVAEERLRKHAEGDSVFFLPGALPEAWVWQVLRQCSADAAKEMGLGKEELVTKLGQLDALYDAAAGRQAEILKTKLRQLAEAVGRTEPDIARVVGRLEAGKKQSDIQPLVEKLKGALLRWRGVDLASRW